MIKRLWICLAACAVLAVSVNIVFAQPGGGNGGGGRPGGGAAQPAGTPIAPPQGGNSGTRPGQGGGASAQSTRPSREGMATPAFEFPSLEEVGYPQPEGWAGFTMPEEWSAFTLPEGSPTTPDDLATYLEGFELPYEFSLDGMTFESSADAAGVMTGFAVDYLGAAVSVLYAGMIDGSSATGEYQATTDQLIAQFPAEMQAMLAQADQLSGITYWGVLADGGGLIYTGECTSPNCTMTEGSIQLQITTTSLGAYTRYLQGEVTSSESAMQMAAAAYPALASMPLTPIATDYGYVFSSGGMNLPMQQITAYYVSVVSVGGQTLVSVAVGVGEGYVEIVR